MQIQELEIERSKCAKKCILSFPLIGIGLLSFILIDIVQSALLVIVGIVLLSIGMIFLSMGLTKFSKIKKVFKTKYLKPLIESTYENCTYDYDKGINETFSHKTRIIPRGDRFSSEDLIQGSFDNTPFLTCDVHVEEKHVTTDSHGNTRVEWVTIFRGRFFEFEFNKNFEKDLVVTESRAETNLSGLSKVKLESVEFNKKFKTFTADEHTAFYILTPQIMERMMKLEKENKGCVSFSFIDSKIFIAINNNVDTFELSLFKKITNDTLLSYTKDIESMKDFVKLLKLNLNIYK